VIISTVQPNRSIGRAGQTPILQLMLSLPGPQAATATRHPMFGANARLELLKQHGHWPNRQSPELVNRLIVTFLTADAPTAAGN